VAERCRYEASGLIPNVLAPAIPVISWCTSPLRSAGTHELTGLVNAASFGVNPSFMTVFNNEVLFFGHNTDAASVNGGDLWVTDGTAAGTHELTGITNAQTVAGNQRSPPTGGGSDAHNPPTTPAGSAPPRPR